MEYLCQLKTFIMFVNLTTLDADITGGVSFWWSIFLRGLFRKDVCPLQDDFLATESGDTPPERGAESPLPNAWAPAKQTTPTVVHRGTISHLFAGTRGARLV